MYSFVSCQDSESHVSSGSLDRTCLEHIRVEKVSMSLFRSNLTLVGLVHRRHTNETGALLQREKLLAEAETSVTYFVFIVG